MVLATMEFLQLRCSGGGCPYLQVVQVPQVVIIPVATLRLIPMVALTMEQLLLDEVVEFLYASSTGSVVEKTVVLPQLHLLRNSLRAAHELRWGFFFKGPVHRYRAGGRVHRDTPPLPQLGALCVHIDRHVRDTGVTWNEIKALPLPWFSGLAILLELVETTGVWPQGLLDAHIAMIPKADGYSTPSGQRPLSVLPVVYRLWASVRLGHLREWVQGWFPTSVFSLGNGLSSVEGWFSTALDIEEVLSGTGGDQLHVMVADVIKSFDTVDRAILDCVLGRLGLPDWFRKVYFSFHCHVRLRFKLAAGLGDPWCRDGGIPQGCPLSMVLIVALYVPWCRHLDALPDVKPQLYADNLKCSAERPRALFESARFTARYVWSVGQDVSLGKCVLLSTSKSVRKAMRLWDISGDGVFWNVQLDVRDLGGHLDFTLRARAGALSKRICVAISGVASVGALPLGFQFKLGLVRGKYLLAGLHAAEASYFSLSISAFRAAIVRAVWSSKMSLANSPALLNLLDGPVGVDPAFHIILTQDFSDAGFDL